MHNHAMRLKRTSRSIHRKLAGMHPNISIQVLNWHGTKHQSVCNVNISLFVMSPLLLPQNVILLSSLSTCGLPIPINLSLWSGSKLEQQAASYLSLGENMCTLLGRHQRCIKTYPVNWLLHPRTSYQKIFSTGGIG